jgi:uncharacterized protein YfiM (DUF2279 family)
VDFPKKMMEVINTSFRRFIFLLLVIVQLPLWAQRVDSLHSFSRKRLNTVVIGGSAAYAGAMVALSSAWYSQSAHQSFHFFNDANEWKQVDKMGHFYSAFQLSSIGSRMLIWSGINKKKSDVAGSITSFGIMSSVEVFDGYSSAYGASLSDLGANLAGSAFYWGQQKLWRETRIYPKFSFHRTGFAAQRPNVLGNGLNEEFLKDYNGQTYWFSVDIDKFFRFPKWINLAFGYGMQNMIYATTSANQSMGLDPYRQYYLSIDFDLTSIKTKSKFINSLIYFANMIKLPAPALEFSRNGVKAHALYF